MDGVSHYRRYADAGPLAFGAKILTAAPIIKGMIEGIDVVIQDMPTQPVNHHRDDCRCQDATDYDQQKFHDTKVTSAFAIATPAGVGPAESADLAMNGRKEPGNPAHIPLFQTCGFMVASETEESSWLTTPNRNQAAVAALVLSLRPLLLFLFYCLRFLLVALSKQQQILQQLAQQKVQLNRHHLPMTQRQLSLWHLPPNKSIHPREPQGGRSDAPAFGVSKGLSSNRMKMRHILQTEVSPC
jgi:hypothetical protein